MPDRPATAHHAQKDAARKQKTASQMRTSRHDSQDERNDRMIGRPRDGLRIWTGSKKEDAGHVPGVKTKPVSPAEPDGAYFFFWPVADCHA